MLPCSDNDVPNSAVSHSAAMRAVRWEGRFYRRRRVEARGTCTTVAGTSVL